MKVKIFGPNLSSSAQQKGAMHVHSADCADNAKYGPGRLMGGDAPSEREASVDLDTKLEIVEYIYPDQIDEQPEDEREFYLNMLIADTWFAPCTKALQ